jgi:hypothetical protein
MRRRTISFLPASPLKIRGLTCARMLPLGRQVGKFMRKVWIVAVALIGTSPALANDSTIRAEANPTSLSPSEIDAAIMTDVYEMTGTYKFIDGDRFFYRCGGTVCEDVLQRDNFLQKHVIELDGHQITIQVSRESCKGELTVQCVRSSNGSYLRVRKWVDPIELGGRG